MQQDRHPTNTQKLGTRVTPVAQNVTLMYLNKAFVSRFSVAPPEGHKQIDVVEFLLAPAKPAAYLKSGLQKKTQNKGAKHLDAARTWDQDGGKYIPGT